MPMAGKPDGKRWGWVTATILIAAGVAMLWWSNDLMIRLIWLVGEEKALGAGNVVRDPNGVHLTNPAAMMRWALPFLILGFAQIIAGITLMWFSYQHLTRTTVAE
jgi:hypothetical protein